MVCTGIGLALLALTRSWGLRVAGVVVILVPHLVGAPQPEVHTGAAPPELAASFVVASAIANAVFWVVLGTGGAVVHGMLARAEQSLREPDTPT